MKKKLPAKGGAGQYYQTLKEAMPELVLAGHDYGPETVAINKATLISNPTHILAKEPWVWYQVQYLMAHAEKQAYIHTPYAVFSKDMYEGMKEITDSVPEVTMLLNATSVGDNFMASSDYTRNRGKILDTGVTLREYFGDHSSHGKSILVDDRLSIVGSYNLDMRSTYVDTETMLVIDGEAFNRQLKACIDDLEADSLVVQADGTYVPDPDVPVIPVPAKKKWIFAVTSRLFQLFRYLI
ncbi:MAG: phospholipase D-like domain-containing protein [[Clostridium] symbiosum]